MGAGQAAAPPGEGCPPRPSARPGVLRAPAALSRNSGARRCRQGAGDAFSPLLCGGWGWLLLPRRRFVPRNRGTSFPLETPSNNPEKVSHPRRCAQHLLARYSAAPLFAFGAGRGRGERVASATPAPPPTAASPRAVRRLEKPDCSQQAAKSTYDRIKINQLVTESGSAEGDAYKSSEERDASKTSIPVAHEAIFPCLYKVHTPPQTSHTLYKQIDPAVEGFLRGKMIIIFLQGR